MWPAETVDSCLAPVRLEPALHALRMAHACSWWLHAMCAGGCSDCVKGLGPPCVRWTPPGPSKWFDVRIASVQQLVWHCCHRVCGVTGSSAARGRHISMTTPYTVRPTKRLKLFKLGIEKLPP